MKAMLRPFILAAGLALASLASAPLATTMAQAAPAAANLTQQQRQEIGRIEQYAGTAGPTYGLDLDEVAQKARARIAG